MLDETENTEREEGKGLDKDKKEIKKGGEETWKGLGHKVRLVEDKKGDRRKIKSNKE